MTFIKQRHFVRNYLLSHLFGTSCESLQHIVANSVDRRSTPTVHSTRTVLPETGLPNPIASPSDWIAGGSSDVDVVYAAVNDVVILPTSASTHRANPAPLLTDSGTLIRSNTRWLRCY